MTASQLPERPDIDQLKRQAKDLLRAARGHDADALARFRALPAFAHHADADLERASLGLHDAQSVIAREYGLDSWNALRERVEELTLEFGAAADAFIEAATDGRVDRAERLRCTSQRWRGLARGGPAVARSWQLGRDARSRVQRAAAHLGRRGVA